MFLIRCEAYCVSPNPLKNEAFWVPNLVKSGLKVQLSDCALGLTGVLDSLEIPTTFGAKNALKNVPHKQMMGPRDGEVTGNDTTIGSKAACKGTTLCRNAPPKKPFSARS